jgi:hypothetical protein
MTASASTRRQALITALDLCISVFCGIGLLILLGARVRITVGGERYFSAVSMWPPLQYAAVLLLVRFALGRTIRFVPSFASATLRARLDAEREWFARTVRMPRAGWYFALTAVAATLIWFTPHLLHIRRVPDAGDPLFTAWRLARVAHQLTHDPLHLFDGNIYYPERYTLTYSDSTLLEGIVATPFIAAGVDPLITANALFLSAFALCALAFFYTGWRLTGDLRAGFIAGVLGGLYPFHTEHYSHFELQFFCFVPLAVLALLRLLAAPHWKRGVMLGMFVALQWLACMYFGMMLLVFLVPVALMAMVGWRIKPSRDLLVAAGVSAGLAGMAFGLIAIPYMLSRATRGDREKFIVTFYSAMPSDYGRPNVRLAAYEWVSRRGNMPERELFPGTAPLALSLVGMLPPLSVGVIATVGATALAFDGSRGNLGLIYDDLYHYLLPFRGMRVAARFSALVGCGLVLLSAYGTRRLVNLFRGPRAQAACFAALTALVLFDLRPIVRVRDYLSTIPSIYSSVTPDMVLAEFPLDQDFDYLYFSTFHWARLINGYSGYTPDSYIKLHKYLAAEFPSAEAVETLRQQGATHITVNCVMYRWRNSECGSVIAKLDEIPGVEPVASVRWEGDAVRLYRLRQRP